MGKTRFSRAQEFLMALGLLLPLDGAVAESRIDIGEPAPLLSSTHLDFTIVIPQVLWLRQSTDAAHGLSNETNAANTFQPQAQPWSVFDNSKNLVLTSRTAASYGKQRPDLSNRSPAVDFIAATP